MKVAVDSSAFVKRYIEEVGSDKLAEILPNASELGLSIILVPEVTSGLNRRLREHLVDNRNYNEIKTQLLDDISDATILQITPGVVSLSVKLLEKNVLRAMDSLHIACALEWKADLFITSDKRQLDAAINSGLQCEFI
ncbi:MAG: type II toxin-antitoxin system VapC family toxin, partial [Spirochaetales bacterium]|nr:type II toxin-antitoxin system VapC family toxin [Spirochaetales bacterium]